MFFETRNGWKQRQYLNLWNISFSLNGLNLFWNNGNKYLFFILIALKAWKFTQNRKLPPGLRANKTGDVIKNELVFIKKLVKFSSKFLFNIWNFSWDIEYKTPILVVSFLWNWLYGHKNDAGVICWFFFSENNSKNSCNFWGKTFFTFFKKSWFFFYLFCIHGKKRWGFIGW